jgi:hypothetical protein
VIGLIPECSLQNSEYYVSKKLLSFVLFKNCGITSVYSISLGPHLFQLFLSALFEVCFCFLFFSVLIQGHTYIHAE